ncbi:RibD family protein [Prosthecomicrobium sp. N25]|uniref:RibD family protein n=1 Tax=Prosthecomicrobium sp. N25 TaxID=3129254 RepID=UPI003076AA03
MTADGAAAAGTTVHDLAHGVPGSQEWREILEARHGSRPVPAPWADLFGPFARSCHSFVIGQFGQSLDGRVATAAGHSKYINGEGGLAHLHRVRALVDAVLVGVSTAIADDPRLDVRLVDGPNPARVVLDPRGRLPDGLTLFRDDGARRLVVVGEDVARTYPAGTEVLRVALGPDGVDPRAVVAALVGAGLPRILVEGGIGTVSRFLTARALDRLHVMVAPVLIGDGPTGICFPGARTLGDCLRPATRVYPLGGDVLFDCDLRA